MGVISGMGHDRAQSHHCHKCMAIPMNLSSSHSSDNRLHETAVCYVLGFMRS